jgi:membrane-associated phospholipid phosphatase
MLRFPVGSATERHEDLARPLPVILLFTVAGLAMGVFALLAPASALDVPLVQQTQRLQFGMEHITWVFNQFLKDFGIPIAWGLSVVLLALRKQYTLAALFLVAMLVGPLNVALKESFARPRPDGPFMIMEFPTDYSFPSAHVMTAIAFFGLWWLAAPSVLPARFVPAVRAVSAVVILMTPVSRVWAAAHWPTDVAAGTLLGIAFVMAVWMIRPAVDTAIEALKAGLERAAVLAFDAFTQPGGAERVRVAAVSLAAVW